MCVFALVLGCSFGALSGCEAEDEDGASESPMFEERCAVLCDISDTGCSEDAQALCEIHCLSRTEFLPFTCGVCVIDNSPGYDVTEACADPGFGRISDPNCLASCADITEQVTDWNDRCLLMCNSESECEGEDDARCFDDCMVQTSGLSTPCALCLLDNSHYPPYDSCDGDFAPISAEECLPFCANG